MYWPPHSAHTCRHACVPGWRPSPFNQPELGLVPDSPGWCVCHSSPLEPLLPAPCPLPLAPPAHVPPTHTFAPLPPLCMCAPPPPFSPHKWTLFLPSPPPLAADKVSALTRGLCAMSDRQLAAAAHLLTDNVMEALQVSAGGCSAGSCGGKHAMGQHECSGGGAA